MASPVGNIYYSTCSWTDRTLIESGVYPAYTTSAAARLKHHATRFLLVEVNSTFYAQPIEANAQRWGERPPDGFVFNLKSYGLLTHHPSDVRRMPADVKKHLPTEAKERGCVYLKSALPGGRVNWSGSARGGAQTACAGR